MTREAKFGELLSYPLRSGVTVASNARGSGIRMLNMGELFRFSRIPSVEMARVSIDLRDPDRTLLAAGDLVFARRSLTLAGAGKCSLLLEVGEPTTWESSIIRARLDSRVADPRFYYYYFQSALGRRAIESIVEQVAAAGIRLSELAHLSVPLPTLGEQRAIADVLSALDDKIAANARLSEGAERLVLALVESNGSLVPLGDVVTHRKLVVDPSALTSERVAHFSLPAFDSGRTPEMVEPRTIKSSKFLVTSPSVLVSKLNPRFLRTWDVATVPDRPALASTEFLVLEPRFSTSTVMWALLSQSTFGAVLESKVAGTSGSHQRVRPEDLLGTPVPDPRAMSDKLKDQVTSLGLRAIQARVESDHLAATRGALLPALMSGRLRVRDAQRDSAGRSQVG